MTSIKSSSLVQKIVAALVCMPVCVNACTGDTDLELSKPIEKFAISNSELSVIDLDTGLVWQRCSVGQEFNTSLSVCEYTPTSYTTWYDALNALSDINSASYDGQSDWRVPNAKELFSLVETGCTSPAINTRAFPNTPASLYYSSSPTRAFDKDSNSIAAGEGLKIPFYFGTKSGVLTNLRLVRNFN